VPPTDRDGQTTTEVARDNELSHTPATNQALAYRFILAALPVTLDTDSQGVAVQWSENSNAIDFAENLMRTRCEGRFATSVYAQAGVVVGDLTA
jgi:hypothetical protein